MMVQIAPAHLMFKQGKWYQSSEQDLISSVCDIYFKPNHCKVLIVVASYSTIWTWRVLCNGTMDNIFTAAVTRHTACVN